MLTQIGQKTHFWSIYYSQQADSVRRIKISRRLIHRWSLSFSLPTSAGRNWFFLFLTSALWSPETSTWTLSWIFRQALEVSFPWMQLRLVSLLGLFSPLVTVCLGLFSAALTVLAIPPFEGQALSMRSSFIWGLWCVTEKVGFPLNYGVLYHHPWWQRCWVALGCDLCDHENSALKRPPSVAGSWLVVYKLKTADKVHLSPQSI